MTVEGPATGTGLARGAGLANGSPEGAARHPATRSYESGSARVAPGWRERLLHFLLPAPCLACAAPAEGRGAGLGLCAGCCARLEPSPAAGLALPAGEAPRSYRRLLWGWHYRPPLDAVIAGLKFRRLDYLGRQLGEQLGRRFTAELAGIDVVAPVPLGFWRRLGRGFDQAETIAAAVASTAGGLRLEALLSRRRSTAPQSLRGGAERRRNLAGAFAARAAVGKTWRGCHILLVDDVITTGATLEAASAALLEAGAGAVTALVAARTPAPAEQTCL